MTKCLLAIGKGVLADIVCDLLMQGKMCQLIRQAELPDGATDQVTDRVTDRATDEVTDETIDLALVLDDGWLPTNHATAEDLFRSLGIPWLRGYVAFGSGFVGPLVKPNGTGCSYCADLRTVMAESERMEMMQIRMQISLPGEVRRDAYATRSGLLHMAFLLVSAIERMFRDDDTAFLEQHMFRTNLKTLDTTSHFILPNAACPVCGTLQSDTPETAVIPLDQNLKTSADSYRTRSMKELENLAEDYLDYQTGLMNNKVYDLITPFAAVSVNLPLVMGDEGTAGRSHSYKECEPIAILEGLERFCGLEPRGKRTAVYDSYAHLKDQALNPVTVGLHAPEQYLDPKFPFRAFQDDMPMGWVWGYSLIRETPTLVPERLAYYSLGQSEGFVYETSNGCAIGGSLVEAIFHGILEVVERDAFLMTWYARLPLPAVDMTSVADRELRWMIERIEAVTGYDLMFYNATMENKIPTVFVIAKNRRPSGLNVLCSAGAHTDGLRAVKGAIQETAGMLLRFDDKLEAHREKYLRMLEDSSLVRHMDDHSMLYGLPEAMGRLDFLLDQNRPVQKFAEAFTKREPYGDLTDDLRDLLDTFRHLNLDVVVINQASPEIARNGLHCVKVMIPGMLPMTFGHQMRRLEHLNRVLTVPMMLGYYKTPLSKEQLNPYPHPFP